MNILTLESTKTRLQFGAKFLDMAHEPRLVSKVKLHHGLVTIDAMVPDEYRNGGEGLMVNYNFTKSPFGFVLIASTIKGVCCLTFGSDPVTGLTNLYKRFPNANFSLVSDEFQLKALCIFQRDWSHLSQIKLHLRGTPFQLEIWEALLKIPMGALASYVDVARYIGRPEAARAVGNAVSQNPAGFLIPCHRVIQKTGNLGGYIWGTKRKSAILGWEAADIFDFTLLSNGSS